MPGRHPPHFVIVRNLAGDLDFVTDQALTSTRTMARTRQSSTGRNAEGLAFTDVYRPLHIVDQVAPALVPDDRAMATSAIYRYDSVPDNAFRSWLDRFQSDPGARAWLIEWGQPLYYTWTADGTATELYLYHVQAADVWEANHGGSPPETGVANGSKATLEYEPRLWVDDVEIQAPDLARVDQATWDGGNPGPGEAWWLDQGQYIRLGDVPPILTKIQAKILPLWRVRSDVAKDGPFNSRGITPGMEPRTLALTEAQD